MDRHRRDKPRDTQCYCVDLDNRSLDERTEDSRPFLVSVLVSDSLEFRDACSFQPGLRLEHLETKGEDGALEGEEVGRDMVDF